MKPSQRKAMYAKKEISNFYVKNMNNDGILTKSEADKIYEREQYLKKKSFELGMKSRASHTKKLSEN